VQLLPSCSAANPKIWGAKMFDFRRVTLFCLEKRLSEHKITIFSENFVAGMYPLSSPGNAYAKLMGVRRGGQNGHFSPPWKLGVRTKIVLKT